MPTVRMTSAQLATLWQRGFSEGIGAMIYVLKSGGGPARIQRIWMPEQDLFVQIEGDLTQSDFLTQWPNAVQATDIQP